jgi:PAS domain S-box-containing protein
MSPRTSPQFTTSQGAPQPASHVPSFAAELGALYASTVVGVGLLGRDLTFIRVNGALAAMNGIAAEDHVGRTVDDLLPSLSTKAHALMETVVSTRRPVGPVDLEGETPARPGERRIWSEAWTPVFDDRGEVIAASVLVADVTEARAAQAAQLARADDVRRILDGVIAFVGRLDPDGTLTEANRQAIEAAGISREDAIGRKFWDCYWWSFSPASQARLRSAITRAAQGETVRYDVEVRVADDRRIWIDFALIPQRDAAGAVVELVPSAVDITDRRAAEEALRTNIDRLHAILSTSQVGIAIAHVDGRVTEANGAFLELVGRTGTDLRTGGIDWRRHLTVQVPRTWRRLLSHGTLGPVEITLRREDGREVPTLASAGLLDARRREIVAFFLDATRQKADEEHRELLLLELKHRVKNMLATVQAITRQTARSTGDRDTLVEALAGRLQAMARAHDLITQRATGEVCLRELILAQVEPYVSREGQLSYGGPGLRIRPDAAHSLGLVLHELATNAAKYGALGAAGGTVAIQWDTGAGDGSAIRIRWSESGGPPVAPPARRGFGSTLIESSLSHGLGGEIAVTYDPAGVRAEMRLPGSALDA